MVGAGNADGSVCGRLMEDICFDKVDIDMIAKVKRKNWKLEIKGR